MTPAKEKSIRSWIRKMGFKLSKSHNLSRQARKINYYTLNNFGVYEEIETSAKGEIKQAENKPHKFTSWTPWGEDFEVNSVKDLSNAYDDFLRYNPDVAVN